MPTFIVSGLTRPGVEPEPTVYVADTLSTRPLIGKFVTARVRYVGTLFEFRQINVICRASERKFFRGYEDRYRAFTRYWAPQALSGGHALKHFLSDGCRSLFKSEGIAIFAYS